MGDIGLEIGDRVLYTGEYYMFSRWLLGEEGIVADLYQDRREGEWCAIVVWDNNEHNKGHCRKCGKKGPDEPCGYAGHGGSGVFIGNVKRLYVEPQWEV